MNQTTCTNKTMHITTISTVCNPSIACIGLNLLASNDYYQFTKCCVIHMGDITWLGLLEKLTENDEMKTFNMRQQQHQQHQLTNSLDIARQIAYVSRTIMTIFIGIQEQNEPDLSLSLYLKNDVLHVLCKWQKAKEHLVKCDSVLNG